jgi:hypothetical protein
MRNKFTKAAYDQVKNTTYTLISFENGRRTLTYGHLTVDKLAKEMTRPNGLVHMVFEDSQLGLLESCERDIQFFIDFKAQLKQESITA